MYASPEIFDSSPIVDPAKIDIFMLGGLFVTILFREFPFKNQKGGSPTCMTDENYRIYSNSGRLDPKFME